MNPLHRLLASALLIAVICGSAHAVKSPAPDPHQQLDQILQQPAYQQWRQQKDVDLPDLEVKLPETWSQRLGHSWDAFTNWLDGLFRSRSRSYSGSGSGSGLSLPGILKVVLIIVIVAAIGLLLLMIFKSIRSQPMQGPTARILSREQLHEALQSGDALALGSVEWMDEARRLAMQQNFRAVYRALYLALLSGLRAAGKIEHNRNRTNWFYVSQYRGPANERTTFSELTDLFDRVWYGRILAVNGNLDEIRRQISDLTRSGRPE